MYTHVKRMVGEIKTITFNFKITRSMLLNVEKDLEKWTKRICFVKKILKYPIFSIIYHKKKLHSDGITKLRHYLNTDLIINKSYL